MIIASSNNHYKNSSIKTNSIKSICFKASNIPKNDIEEIAKTIEKGTQITGNSLSEIFKKTCYFFTSKVENVKQQTQIIQKIFPFPESKKVNPQEGLVNEAYERMKVYPELIKHEEEVNRLGESVDGKLGKKLFDLDYFKDEFRLQVKPYQLKD